MEGSRFRVSASAGPPRRAPSASPHERPWSLHPARRSFSAREPFPRRALSNAFEAASRFGTSQGFVGDGNNDSDLQEELPLPEPGPNASSMANDYEKSEADESSSSSKSNSTDMQEPAGCEEMLLTHPTDIEDHFGASFAEIEDMLEGLRDFSRIPTQLHDEFQILKGTAHKQKELLSKEQENSSKLSKELRLLRKEFEELKVSKQNSDSNLNETTHQLHKTVSECEQLQQNVKGLKEECNTLKIDHETEHNTWQIKLQRMQERLRYHDEVQEKKEKQIAEIKKELAYIQRRIEDEIAARAKMTVERDDSAAQVAQLRTSLYEQKKQSKAADEHHRSTLNALQAEHTASLEHMRIDQKQIAHRMNVEIKKVKQQNALQEQSQEQERGELKKSLQELKKSLSMSEEQRSNLVTEKEAVNQSIDNLAVLQKIYLKAVAKCRSDRNDSGTSKFAPFCKSNAQECTTIAGTGIEEYHASREELPKQIPLQSMKRMLWEAATREILLTHGLASANESMKSFSSIRDAVIICGNDAKSAVGQVKLDLLGVMNELPSLKCRISEAQNDEGRQRAELEQRITGLEGEKDSLQNSLILCRDELKEAKSKLLEAISRAKSIGANAKDRLGAADQENAKLRQDMESRKQELQKLQAELLATSNTSQEAIKKLQNSLKKCESELSAVRMSQSTVAELQKVLVSKEQEKKSLLSKLRKSDSERRQLEEDLTIATDLAHFVKTSGEEKHAKVTKSLLEASDEIASLKGRLQSAIADKEFSERKLAESDEKANSAFTTPDKRSPVGPDRQLATKENIDGACPKKTGIAQSSGFAEKCSEGNRPCPYPQQRVELGTGKEEKESKAVQEDSTTGRSPTQKKRQPSKPVPKTNKPKRSRVRNPKAVMPRGSKTTQEGTLHARRRSGRQYRPSRNDDDDDDDWVVNDIMQN